MGIAVRVLLVPNTANDRAVGAVAEIAAWCAASGLEPVLVAPDAVASGLDGYAVTADEIGVPALTVALGGDGTILKAFHLMGGAEVPLLGVKFGRLGFLSGVRPEGAREAIQAALAGEACIERRATLSAKLTMGGREVGTYRSLNEVVLARGESGRVIAFDVTVGGHHLARIRADGIVVATATGSTAYALSAGGPVVAPGFGGMVVVPVAPHTLQTRAVVTDPAEVVEIGFPDPSRADARLIVDGSPVPGRGLIGRLTVRRGDHDVLLVKSDGRDFYETVAEEFFSPR